jgi:hypothetical protein
MVVKRRINGEDVKIILTSDEIEEVRRQDKIEWAKNIIDNFDLVDKSVCKNEDLLIQIAEEIEEKTLCNNGDVEYGVLKKFGLV